MEKTRLSSKGQIVIPKSVRDAHGWKEGTEFAVEDRTDGVFLRLDKKNPFTRTTIDDVFGCLKYDGPAKTVEEMQVAIENEAARRYRKAVGKK